MTTMQLNFENVQKDDMEADILNSSIINSSNRYLAAFAPETPALWAFLSMGLWWFVLAMTVISLALYLYNGILLLRRKQWQQQPLLFSIISMDSAMLLVVALITLIQPNLPPQYPLFGSFFCKAEVFVSNFAAFYTNWAWFLLWASQFMAVFWPLKHHRFKSYIGRAVPVLLVLSLMSESWALILTTEYLHGEVHFCWSREDLVGPATLQYLTLTEIALSYAIPLLLSSIANLVVLFRPCITKPMPSVRAEQLNNNATGSNATSGLSTVRILPRNYHQKRQRYRQRALARSVLAGFIDLAFNLPTYLLHVVDNIWGLRQICSGEQLALSLETVVYVPYYLQYPLILLYIRLLIRERQQKSAEQPVRRRSHTAPGSLFQSLLRNRHLTAASGTASRFSCPAKDRANASPTQL